MPYKRRSGIASRDNLKKRQIRNGEEMSNVDHSTTDVSSVNGDNENMNSESLVEEKVIHVEKGRSSSIALHLPRRENGTRSGLIWMIEGFGPVTAENRRSPSILFHNAGREDWSILMDHTQTLITRHSQSEIRNTASKFNRTKLALKCLQEIAKEKDINLFLVDILKFTETCSHQSFKLKLTVAQSIHLKTCTSISFRQIETMKKVLKSTIGLDFFPNVKEIRKVARSQSLIQHFQARTVVNSDGEEVDAILCNNIFVIIRHFLEKMHKQLIFDEYSGENIVLGLGGDCGGGTTKFCVIFGNLAHPNNTDHILTVAVYDGADTYENMQLILKPLFEQINRLNKITYTENGVEKTRPVRQLVTGDFKFISEMLSHMKQSARYFCSFCESENPRNSKQTIGKLRPADRSTMRTLSTYMKYSKSGEKGVKKGLGPLLMSVLLINYLPGMLHMFLGLFDRYILRYLWIFAVTADNTTEFAVVNDRKNTLKAANEKITKAHQAWKEAPDGKKKEFRLRLDNLKKEKDKFDNIVNGATNGLLRQLEFNWERLGASRRAFFQSFNGNQVRRILTANGIEATFAVFDGRMTSKLETLRKSMENLGVLMSLSGNRLLNQTDLRAIRENAWNFAFNLAESFPEESVTQKLHILLFHVPGVSEQQKTLGKINEQGIEAKHAQFNRLERRLSSFRSKKERWLHVAQELLCSNLLSIESDEI
ncbi:unnamed protein product [Caenorhabditis sp. 36 PRJEB53466]|nr:unnamed protein product [Caenorhabditis sp. 36 PRJEB53466]